MTVHPQSAGTASDDGRLHGRVVLVTGGSRGVGLACARAFARGGARVAIAGRDPAHLHAAVDRLRGEGLHVLPLMADLSRPEQALQMAASLVAQLGVADVVVNAMAVRARPRLEAGQQPLEWWDAMQARLLPALQALQALLPGMRARGRGVVVNLGAALNAGAAPRDVAAGSERAGATAAACPWPDGVSLAPEVCAADALAQAGAALAARVAADGLRINTVLTAVTSEAPDEPSAARVADCVLFLAGPAAAAVNGATIAAGA